MSQQYEVLFIKNIYGYLLNEHDEERGRVRLYKKLVLPFIPMKGIAYQIGKDNWSAYVQDVTWDSNGIFIAWTQDDFRVPGAEDDIVKEYEKKGWERTRPELKCESR